MKKKGIKRIFISFTLLSSLFAVAQAQNHDDVYDDHFKKEKVKKTAVVQPAPPEINNYEVPVSSEPNSQLESGEISTRVIQPNETTNSEYRYNDQNERNSNVDATESDYRMSYTDRLNRFENGNQDSRWSWGVTNTWGNSNFGWNNGFNNNWGWNSGFNNNWGWGNSFNDPWFGFNSGYTSIFIVNNNPWNNFGWNNGWNNNFGWGNSWNTPFWGNPVVINNYNPFNNPHCINNYYNDYGPQRDVVYGPRGGAYNNTPQNNNYGQQQNNSGITYGKDVKNPVNNQPQVVTPQKPTTTNPALDNFYGNGNNTPIDYTKTPKNVVVEPTNAPINQGNNNNQNYNNGVQTPPIKTPKNNINQPIKNPSEETISTPKAPVKPQYEQPVKIVKEPKYAPQQNQQPKPQQNYQPKPQQNYQPQNNAPKPANNSNGIKTNKVIK